MYTAKAANERRRLRDLLAQVSERFGDVEAADGVAFVQIGQGAGDPQEPMITAGGELHALGGLGEHPLPSDRPIIDKITNRNSFHIPICLAESMGGGLMRYFVTEMTEIGPIKRVFPTARAARSFVEAIDLSESKRRIVDEHGAVIDTIDLRIRAEQEGS